MKRSIIMLSLGIISTVTGCTGGFRDINVDLSGITEEHMQIDYNNLCTPFHISQQCLYFNYDFGKGKNWPYQIIQNLNADMFSGYLMDYKPHNGGSHNSDYNLQEGWNSSNWLYTYSYTMPQLKKSEDSTRVKYPVLYAVTKVIKVEAMHRIADVYGPVIYTGFGQLGCPAADTLEETYRAFFKDLDEALILFDDNGDNEAEISLLPRFDILLNGKLDSWKKFANSLRMRLAIRIAMAAPEKARTEFLKSINHPAGVFEEAHEIAAISTRNGYSNPLGEINRVWNESQMNASMESILNGYEDPRRHLFFEPCEEDIIYTNDEGEPVSVALKGNYKGIRQGTMFTHLLYSGHSKIYVNSSTSPVLLSAAEVWFLRAEAALRGWTNENAGSCYRQGVDASFRQWGITSSVDEYLERDNIGADYIDAFDQGNNIEARCRVSPKWMENTSNEEKLEKIITQKWLAVFPEGCEAWAEQRRTGYPRLFPVRFNNSKDGNIDTETMIRRLNFPADMADTDPEQYISLQEALGAPDLPGTRLWWDTGKNF